MEEKRVTTQSMTSVDNGRAVERILSEMIDGEKKERMSVEDLSGLVKGGGADVVERVLDNHVSRMRKEKE